MLKTALALEAPIVINHPVTLNRRNPLPKLRLLRRAYRELDRLTLAWREANRVRGKVDSSVEENSKRAGAASQAALNAMRTCYILVCQLEDTLGLPPAETPAPKHYYYP